MRAHYAWHTEHAACDPQALEAKQCYGSSSLEHPGVQMISMERGRYYLGGRIHGLELPKRWGAGVGGPPGGWGAASWGVYGGWTGGGVERWARRATKPVIPAALANALSHAHPPPQAPCSSIIACPFPAPFDHPPPAPPWPPHRVFPCATPSEVRGSLPPGADVVAFQCRNPIHRWAPGPPAASIERC